MMNRYFLISLITLMLPWKLKRVLLVSILKYDIHPTAKIGLSMIYPKQLIMDKHAYIGHFNLCKNIDLLKTSEKSIVSNLNWITGVSTNDTSFFSDEFRKTELILNEHAAITSRHIIDCSNSVSIGKFTTIAGYRSQILTHSIDLNQSRQTTEAVKIGNYCFIGTNCVLLKGSILPNYCVLGADSILNKAYSDEYMLYAGVPAIPKNELAKDMKYFSRKNGFIN